MRAPSDTVPVKLRQRVRAGVVNDPLPLSVEDGWANWDSYGFVLAQRVRSVRIMRGLTQLELARLSGLSRNFISNLERNETASQTSSDPVLSKIYRLAMALQVPPAVLLPSVSSEVTTICTDEVAITGITPMLIVAEKALAIK